VKKIMNISSLSVMASAIALSLIFTGCGDTDPENDGNHLPDVNIEQNNKTINVGTKVDLTSTASDVDGDALTYEWKFVSKPTGSLATLTTTTTKEASFTADKAGKYVVQFVATDVVDAIGKDTVTITAINGNTCSSYTTINDDINEDTVFDGCYKITRNIFGISKDTLLTIKPGSTILFSEGGGINVDGALNAVGTAQRPILFTAEQKTAGYWGAIRFRGSNDTRNELAHATIEYGGGASLHDEGSLHTIGNYGADNRLKLSNLTIKHSASHGFNLEGRTKLDKFENITSTKNAKTAGVVNMNILGDIDRVSDFTGNLGGDYIVVKYGDVEKSTTWKKLTVPLNIQRDISIYDEVILTLEAGVHLVFNNDKKLTTGPLGALKAIGTESEPILFTGKQKTTGYWMGITIGSDSTNNILENTIFEYAGGGSSDGAVYLNTSYVASSGVRANITSSIFRNNSSYGIYISYNDDAIYNKDIESSNTFINNEKGAIGYR